MRKKVKSSLACLLMCFMLYSCGTENGDSSSNSMESSLTDASSSVGESSSNSMDSSTNTDSSLTDSSSSSDTPIEDSEYITIAEAIAIANEAGENVTEEKYYVKGRIKTVSNPTYGEMTIEDETGSLFVYGVYADDMSTRYDEMEEKPYAGDDIWLLGALKMFKGTPEMDRGYMQKFVRNQTDIDVTQYPVKTVSEARTLAADEKAKLTGVVSFITYANGYKPNGFYLTDSNGSIYVYGSQAAQQVKIGNTITVAAEKTYYVMDSEKSYAEKFGYQGCVQMQNPYILDNKNDTAEIDLSWAKETTVKDIMNTPLTTNITTDIFKVNSLVKKVPGSGFVNYYFDDLDGKTGSYTYTSNNGGDFDWLDPYDGKICTVYLSPINCKSTNSGCVYRFVPIKVIDENFTFDVAKAPKFVLDYYAVDQFKDTYTADPSVEVVTSVSSDLLKFENVTVTYTSDNTNSVYFATEDDKTIFHTKNAGTAKVTITAKYGSYTATEEVTIIVKEEVKVDSVNVKTAIETTVSSEVTVKGVVTASVVNIKGAFYLSDETGVISVKLANGDAEIKNIGLGDEIIITGTRTYCKPGSSAIGQAVIDEAVIVANNYGNNTYSTASYTNATFDEIYALVDDVSVDQTTKIFTTKVKITASSSNYSANYYVASEDGSKSIQLYSGSGSQYEFLKPFVNQVVTVEFALCNWNTKTAYKGAVLAVVTGSGKVINSCNFN